MEVCLSEESSDSLKKANHGGCGCLERWMGSAMGVWEAGWDPLSGLLSCNKP